MGEERLSSLAIVNINREIGLDYNAILDIFARDFPHRMKLENILNTDNF